MQEQKSKRPLLVKYTGAWPDSIQVTTTLTQDSTCLRILGENGYPAEIAIH